MVEPISGKCSKRKAEGKGLMSDGVEFKAKNIKQKAKMNLLYCTVYNPQWPIINIFKSKHGNKIQKGEKNLK